MRFTHPDRPGLALRLGYGMNLYPSRDAAGVLAGLRDLALPLRARMGAPAGFGVGAWMPARAAREFLADERRFEQLVALCAEGGLDPFTWNAFPQGDFHGPGLKERVFVPAWNDPARLAFTLDVARLAVRLCARLGHAPERAHVSISTHAGGFAAALGPQARPQVADGFLAAAAALAQLEAESGTRVVLALEPEPRSSANDTRELETFLAFLRTRAKGPNADALRRHLGACLDACHAAVEFEAPPEALARATAGAAPLGKLQFSSALALRAPDEDPAARAALLALDEPVYLHQVTGRRGSELLRADDLGALARQAERWHGCDEWRCHFHVPVDRASFQAAAGLATTRAEADAALDAALAAPERWGSSELHVEVETYTWTLLPEARGGTPDVVLGLERELRHVLARLGAAGWRPPG